MKKRKYLLTILIIILSIHFYFYNTLKTIYIKDMPLNSKATMYFLHASTIKATWINILRFQLGLQYDNILIQPFMNFRDYLFQKGVENIDKNNAEDVFWWYVNYAKMYSIKEDGQNIFIQNINIKEHKKLMTKVKYLIHRLGNNKVYTVKEDRDSNMYYLVKIYISGLNSQRYIEKIKLDMSKKSFWLDKNILNNMQYVYKYANQVFDKGMKKKYLNKYTANKITLLKYILYSKILQGTLNCSDKHVYQYIQYYRQLLKALVSKNNEDGSLIIDLKNDFLSQDNQIRMVYVFNKIDKYCTRQQKFTNEIKKIIKNEKKL